MLPGDQGTYTRLTDASVLRFSRLFDRSPQEIAEFAARSGVFGAKRMKRNAPRRPNEITFLAGADVVFGRKRWTVSDWCKSLQRWPKGPRGPYDSEPITVWRFLCRRAYAMLRINSVLEGPAIPLPR